MKAKEMKNRGRKLTKNNVVDLNPNISGYIIRDNINIPIKKEGCQAKLK